FSARARAHVTHMNRSVKPKSPLRARSFQPAPPHRDSSTPSIDAAAASLEYRGAAARAAAASRWRSTGLPASLSIAAAMAAGFSGGTQPRTPWCARCPWPRPPATISGSECDTHAFKNLGRDDGPEDGGVSQRNQCHVAQAPDLRHSLPGLTRKHYYILELALRHHGFHASPARAPADKQKYDIRALAEQGRCLDHLVQRMRQSVRAEVARDKLALQSQARFERRDRGRGWYCVASTPFTTTGSFLPSRPTSGREPPAGP